MKQKVFISLFLQNNVLHTSSILKSSIYIYSRENIFPPSKLCYHWLKFAEKYFYLRFHCTLKIILLYRWYRKYNVCITWANTPIIYIYVQVYSKLHKKLRHLTNVCVFVFFVCLYVSYLLYSQPTRIQSKKYRSRMEKKLSFLLFLSFFISLLHILFYFILLCIYIYMYDHLYVCMWVEDSASIIHDIPGSKKEKKIEIDKREGKTNRYRGRKII